MTEIMNIPPDLETNLKDHLSILATMLADRETIETPDVKNFIFSIASDLAVQAANIRERAEDALDKTDAMGAQAMGQLSRQYDRLSVFLLERP